MVPMRISMHNAFPVYITLLAVVLLLSCTDREKYHRLLSEAEEQNSNYIPFTTDSAMLDVVDFYDSHGNANERMKAHYLLGCVYRDLGEAPKHSSAITMPWTAQTPLRQIVITISLVAYMDRWQKFLEASSFPMKCCKKRENVNV